MKEYHQGALEVAEHRELVGNLFVIGDQFDTELEEVVGDVTAPDDPLAAVVEEQKHVVAGEEQKHVVDGAVPPEEPGPKVGTNVVSTKVG